MSHNTWRRVASVIGLGLLVPLSASAETRVRPGDRMQPFTATRVQGLAFSYEHRRGRALVLLFLAARQTQSERAADEVRRVVWDLTRTGHPVDLIAISSRSDSPEYFRNHWQDADFAFPVLIDEEYRLWGRFGIVATPTLIVVDREGVVSWVKAGYSYGLARTVRARLAGALAIREEAGEGGAPLGEPHAARAAAHLETARLLVTKGRVQAAISQLEAALSALPGSVVLGLELGRLLCLEGRADEALRVLRELEPASARDRSQARMLSGWAHAQLGDTIRAEELLREALHHEPDNVRALWELGKLYERLGRLEEALGAYRQALAAHFGEESTAPRSGETEIEGPPEEAPGEEDSRARGGPGGRSEPAATGDRLDGERETEKSRATTGKR